MARAIDTIFFCPPLRLSPGRSKNLATSGNTVSACASASTPPAAPRAVLSESQRLIMRFSATVNSGKMPEFSGA